MPGSPRQHELDREAIEHIRSNLPSRWPREPVQNDYGIDLRVEIHENYQATGLRFEIQSKGHERLQIVYSDQIAQSIKVSTLNYFEKVLTPVLLVTYCARQKKAYYLWVKPYIREVLDEQKPDWRERDGQSEITLHVPLVNVLDETAHDDILAHVEAEHAQLEMRRGPFTATLPYREESAVWRLSTSSRLIRPRVADYLHRPRLTKRLEDTLPKQAVFLHADAGYGKTWLIHDLVGVTTSLLIWYTFSKDSIGAMQFIEQLASEVFRQTNEIGGRTSTYLRARGRDARPDEAVAILIDEIQSSTIQVLLAIEDLHHVCDSAVLSVIESLVVSRPPNLRLILTSRLPLPFGQAKLVAQGLLAVIERAEIAFHSEETQQYLEKNLELSLEPEQIQYMHNRTGGWIAAIGLAANALQEISPDKAGSLFERLHGFAGHIHDFFAEEVYGGLGTETRRILKRLALVQDIRPAIVDLFTMRTNGGQVLRDLTRHNTFLIENDSRTEGYRLHALFAEFLKTRFQDEEGKKGVRSAHCLLAHYYSESHEWYAATQHALDAQEYELAIQGLGIIAPIGVKIGYGRVVLEMIDRIPASMLEQSAHLQEVLGQAALQMGNPRRASEAFHRAQKLYQAERDYMGLNRLSYFLAEVELSSGDITRESFVETVDQVVSDSYKHNDFLFGAQVELRLIEIGQTLTMQVEGLYDSLVERSESLVSRIEQLGDEYALIRARALADQAHLLFQAVSHTYLQSITRVHTRLQTGHPVPLEERVTVARALIEGLQHVSDLYTEAERIASEESEIEWARIHLHRIYDHAYQMSLFQLVGAKLGMTQDPSLLEAAEAQARDLIESFLPTFQGCAQIFAEYHMLHDLAQTYCDMADIYDLVGDLESRNRLAQEALKLAQERGLDGIARRARRVLEDEVTFSSLRSRLDQEPSDRDLALSSEEDKARFTEFCLRAYAGDADIEGMREASRSDVEDMVAAAKQRVEWCRHVQIIQDLEHTRSLATVYRTIPEKWIVCTAFGYRSPFPGHSFEGLWPFFKGGYCLGCRGRSPAD